MFWRLLFGGLLFHVTSFQAVSSADEDKVDILGCNSNKVCLPGAEDIAVQPRTITASNTCGSPPYTSYRPLGTTERLTCNSSNADRHPARFMIDSSEGYSTSNLETWWQSQNWWEWRNQHSQEPLLINITISFNKSYVLTGDVRVMFKYNKPQKMIMEKSIDFGVTWTPLQYFADDCQEKFGMDPSALNCSTQAVLCSEKYSDQNEGPLYFSYLNCYTRQTFWDPKIQDLMEATDIRLRLQYPATDGFQISKTEPHLQRYFYAISDIQVYGRCQCNGHAPYCEFPENGHKTYLNIPTCRCMHNTDGINCERCEPLYNNKTWMPATSMSEPNMCEKCECYKHADSCTFNNTLEHGVCDDCQHNTTGYLCEQCKDKFYRNLSRPLNDSLVCLDCNCTLEGVTNNGSCSQEVSSIGQCQCKQNVTGRRCDRCEDAYYGYTLPPVGNCVACECRGHGTINGSLNCHQGTGQCFCKNNTELRTCSQCKLGFYNFPNTTEDDCLKCDCDYGGSTVDICEKSHGVCLCREGVQGERCSKVADDRFFPAYDHLLYEAEYQPGNYSVTSNKSEYNKYFTGRGYAELQNDQYIEFRITVQVKNNFTLVLRYSEALGSLGVWVRANMTGSDCPAVDRNISLDHLQADARDASWESPDRVPLCPGNDYTIRVHGVDVTASNFSIKVDSLLLLPELTKLRSHSYMAPSVDACQGNFTTTKGRTASALQCENVTFSTMVELFNGSLACGCSLVGASNNTCQPYGGQCPCKRGVMGRTCDRCEPGFYNFTENGCTPCECDARGSENFVCDESSGYCLCKRLVEGRACDHCEQHSYGIHTGQGCSPCHCNTTGSINKTCDDVTGKCYCRPGVEDINTDKCDRCQRNYFNFTQDGCQACNCDEAGSRSLQCHSTSGECACKINVLGMKCNRCTNETYSLEKANPSGCIPCFCFNRSDECWSKSGFISSEIKQNNTRMSTQGYARLSTKFLGNHLYSYVRQFELNITIPGNISDVSLHLRGVKHSASLVLNASNCHTPEVGRYCVILHEKYTQEKLTAYHMQSILADVREASLNASVDNATQVDVSMGTAIKGRGGEAVSHVEECECPSHYKSLSCENCNTGFTRATPNANAFEGCDRCSCNNRSTTCDGEDGTCEDCVLSKGKDCEICEDGVDLESDCTTCRSEYWIPDIHKHGACKACNCVLNNTVNHNSSVCNVTSGQCSCKSYVGGRRCEHCVENYFNTSHGCRECPECYGLMKVYVHKLRDLIKEVETIVEKLKNRSKTEGNNAFARRLSAATTKVDNIYHKANLTAGQDPNNLNTTINELDNLTSNVKKLVKHVIELKIQEQRLRLLVNNTANWTENAYNSLLDANHSRPEIEQLRDTIQSFLQPLEAARDAMQALNQTLWSEAENLTITSKSGLDNMSRVLSHAQTVRRNLGNNNQEIDALQNETQISLKDAQNTKNVSTTFSEKTDVVLDISQNILQTVEHVTDVIEANRNLTRRLDDDISSPNNLAYASTKINASISVKKARIESTRAGKLWNMTEELLTEVKDVEDNAIKANESAKKTLTDARETRQTLDDFQNKSQSVMKVANKSLEQISGIKAESERSIEQIRNVSDSVRDGLNSSDEAMTLADEAHALASAENQATASVYNRSQALTAKHRSTVCSRDLMTSYRGNITTRVQVLTPLLATCPRGQARNTSVAASEVWRQGKETTDDSLEILQDAKTIQEGTMETKVKVENLDSAVESKTHQTRVDSHSELFKGLREELRKLRRAKERRAEVIRDMKERVRTMKLEIRDLESLRHSFGDLPPCSSI